MSLLMLKTKNLSWQDHTLNIEAMLAPLRSTLLLNKHKTLDAKFDQEKALYQRQRDACIKDFVVEKRLIERRRQKIINRKREILQEIRSQSALDHAHEKNSAPPSSSRADAKERSFSAPSSDRRLRGGGNRQHNNNQDDPEGVANITSALPRLTLKQTPLFGGNPLRPRLFLETGVTAAPPTPGMVGIPPAPTPVMTSTTSSTTNHAHSISSPGVTSGSRMEANGAASSKLPSAPNLPHAKNTQGFFITGGGQHQQQQKQQSMTSSTNNKLTKTPTQGKTPKVLHHTPSHQKHSSGAYFAKPPKTPQAHQSQTQQHYTKTPPPPPTPQHPSLSSSVIKPHHNDPKGGGKQGNRRVPNVTFLGLLNNSVDDDDDNNNNNIYDDDGRITVEVKQKTIEDKVREFLNDLETFNSRPTTSFGDEYDDAVSVFSSVRSRDIASKQPLVATRYHTLTLDKKLLERAFDRYMERRSHDDLLKAMKLAAKMKAHIRQARNTSIVTTMATVKSSRTFLKILKRQQRKEKQQAHTVQ